MIQQVWDVTTQRLWLKVFSSCCTLTHLIINYYCIRENEITFLFLIFNGFKIKNFAKIREEFALINTDITHLIVLVLSVSKNC